MITFRKIYKIFCKVGKLGNFWKYGKGQNQVQQPSAVIIKANLSKLISKSLSD